MKKMIFLICALFFVLTGFNQQERFVEQSNTEILGSVSAIGEKPKIMQELMYLEVNEGGIAVFLAYFEPKDDSTIQSIWYHNGRPILTDDRVRASIDKGWATLIINKVRPEDAGIYRVKIYNLWGEVTSDAGLTVTD